jgi:hypothetical protein
MTSTFKNVNNLFWGLLFGVGLLISTVFGLVAKYFG